MHKKTNNWFWLLICPITITLLTLASCGSIKKELQFLSTKLTIESNPYASAVFIDGKYLGQTPLSYDIGRNNEILQATSKHVPYIKTFTFVHPDYGQGTLDIDLTKYIGGTIRYDFTRAKQNEEDVVSREDPGSTEMENTIIRWNIDSDPRGSRLFWRVISNVPSQVKNTNEAYLTTTPYEETRSFNILGLTYNNSKDVVIEIKVTKRGYEDQVKRYNVRQALDQQEISGFFELVKKTKE